MNSTSPAVLRIRKLLVFAAGIALVCLSIKEGLEQVSWLDALSLLPLWLVGIIIAIASKNGQLLFAMIVSAGLYTSFASYSVLNSLTRCPPYLHTTEESSFSANTSWQAENREDKTKARENKND